jgi:hypothetical protein
VIKGSVAQIPLLIVAQLAMLLQEGENNLHEVDWKYLQICSRWLQQCWYMILLLKIVKLSLHYRYLYM